MHEIYEPREDSEQLAKEVKSLARGKTLDMGTGSGIQAISALKNENVTEVIAVDINPNVIDHMNKRIKDESLKNIQIIESNLFENLDEKDKFDTIIFNPPYLPNEEEDEDIALYGGKEGWEIPVKFLEEAPSYLSEGGQILFLFSSLTIKEKIDETIKNIMKMKFTQLSEQSMFFEKLYVYRIYF